MSKRRVHVFVAGKVQGVCYRASTQAEAVRLGLSGWVKNLPDGRVEFVAEGEVQAVDALVHWARKGPEHAQVSSLDLQEEPLSGSHSAFSVRPLRAPHRGGSGGRGEGRRSLAPREIRPCTTISATG